MMLLHFRENANETTGLPRRCLYLGPFRGNSAGVVLHADGLSDAQMQLIARELRHSETAFC
jgi:hypothetical protein